MVGEAGNRGVENIGIRLGRRMPRNDADPLVDRLGRSSVH